MDSWTIVTGIAYVVMNYGVIVQIKRTITRKSVEDVALTEVCARLGAMLLLVGKFWTMNQTAVAIGHTCLTTFYLVYTAFAVRYRLAARRAARRHPPG